MLAQVMAVVCTLLGAPGPAETVQLAEREAKAALRADADGTRLREVTRGLFDYGELARRALGDSWGRMRATDRQTLVSLLRGIIEARYRERSSGLTGVQITELHERIRGDEAVVLAEILYTRGPGRTPEGQQVIVKLVRRGTWRAYDVIVAGTSLVESYEAQFRRIIAREGVPELLRRMRAALTTLEELQSGVDTPPP
jgi:phospholipid transport system substrate-binding protein